MEYTPKLTDMDVMEQARDVLTEHLPLEADGYVCTGADLWQILLGVSAKQGTIHKYVPEPGGCAQRCDSAGLSQ